MYASARTRTWSAHGEPMPPCCWIAVAGGIAIQQHGGIGSPCADQVRVRADAYIHFHGTVEVLLGFSPAIETCRKLATGESQRAIADETDSRHADLIGDG